MSANTLLISAETIKSRTPLHTNVEAKLINPYIKVAQDLFIHPLLGTALYNKIQDEINASGVMAASDYKNLVDDYIADALIWYTLSMLPDSISYQIWNKGVVRKQGDNTELPSIDELVLIGDKFRNTAESYGQRLTKYLQQNATETLFPEYLSPGDGVDTIHPAKDSFTMPIYLGDEQETKRPYDNYRDINI